MIPDAGRLRRHLVIAVAVKVVALWLLWWLFVRDSAVVADAERTAAHIGAAASPSGVRQ